MLTNGLGIGSGKVFAIGAINFLNCCHCLQERESAMLLSILAMCLALNRTLCNISLYTKCQTNSMTRLFFEDCLLITLTNDRLSTLNETFLFCKSWPHNSIAITTGISSKNVRSLIISWSFQWLGKRRKNHLPWKYAHIPCQLIQHYQ